MINKSKPIPNEEIDLVGIFKTLLREKYLIIFITFFSTLFSTIYFSRVPPLWLGSFNIVVRKDYASKENMELNALSLLSGGAQNNDNETQRLILESPSVLMPVFEYVRNYYLPKTGKTQNINFKSWIETSLNIDFTENSNVLNVVYKSKDKELILNVLDLISTKYKDYSKRDTTKNLLERRTYLENQIEIMSKKTNESKKEFNRFTIENRLGNIDIFANLGYQENSSISGMTSNNKQILNPNTQSPSINSRESGATGQRFAKTFRLLEKYESKYVDLSSKLKPNSKILTDIKQQIDNLNDALKRPNEILIKYDELYRNYTRNQKFLMVFEQNLELVKLEQMRILNPWEIISTPYVEVDPIYPKKSNLFILSVIASFILSSISAFIKEKLSRKIFSRFELEQLIDCNYIDTIFRKEQQLSFNQIINQFINNKSQVKIFGIINFKNKLDISFLKELLNNEKEVKINDFTDKDFIKNSSRILIILEPGKYTFEDIEIINKYISLSTEKIIGWFYLN
tara:strand:+ start:2673 stop:4211 length:1539 start_codon:yes stop_codon:yes gene_type:complete